MAPYIFLYPTTKGMKVWFCLEVKNYNDPKDMFLATVGIIRYATNSDYLKLKEQNYE